MSTAPRDPSTVGQLRQLLRLAGAHPGVWVATTIAASIVLAFLDMLGVAAMIPLTQLLAGFSADSGALGVIADIVGSDDPAALIPIVAGAIAVLFVFKSVLALLFRWWLFGQTSRVSALVSTALMHRYVLAPYAHHRSRRLSEVYRNITAATSQATSVLMAVISLCTDVLLLAGIVVVLAITAPLVTLLTVALFAGFVFGLQRVLRRRQSHLGEEVAEAGLQAWQFLMPALDGFREARLTSSAAMFVDGFRASRMREARAAREMGIISEIPRYSLEILFVVAIVGISLYLFANEPPGTAFTVLGVFAAAALRALPTLARVSTTAGTIRIGSVGLRIVLHAVEELDEGGTHDEQPRSDAKYEGDITLDHVAFRYPDSADPVFHDLTLTIPRDRTTAFVGSSGAGKSTLLDLILGLQEPTSGEIRCGDRSVFDDKASWYASLGVVPQDVFLTNDSVRANIAFGVDRSKVDEARVRDVVELAQLSDLVAELPDGLDTVVGERGVRLSGGQRQRLGLARALYREPSILVLDEATSALDNVTEHEITGTLTRLSGSLTILIVAHRLSTVRHADNLVFLQGGRIEAQGTFSELRHQNLDFARLVELGDLR
jgi:ABC-type multidrug transport system fused ATPase/permease subunit